MKRHDPGYRFEAEPCTPHDCVYVAHVNSFGFGYGDGWGQTPDDFVSKVHIALDKEALNYIGLRFWLAGASFRVVEGRVQSHSGMVAVEGPEHRWRNVMWELSAAMPEPEAGDFDYFTPDLSACTLYVKRHFLSWGLDPGGGGLSAQLTAHASEEEKRKAFNINWSCLTKLGGCSSNAELAPELAEYTNDCVRGEKLVKAKPSRRE